MSTHFLAIQSTYTSVECALFHDNVMVDKIEIDKSQASKRILIALEQLLATHELALKNISFAAVNTGPAPFTTLRVVIATMNGISFASPLPLIGIDGLEAMTQEYFTNKNNISILLLNAFNKDVYFALQNKDGAIEKGCIPLSNLLERLSTTYGVNTPLTFIGSGALLHKKEIETVFGPSAHFLHTNADRPSIKKIGMLGLRAWQEKNGIQRKIVPLYLKTHAIT